MQLVRFVLCGLVALAFILATMVSDVGCPPFFQSGDDKIKALLGLKIGFKLGKRIIQKKSVRALKLGIIAAKIWHENDYEPREPHAGYDHNNELIFAHQALREAHNT